MSSRLNVHRLITEFIGTFFLVFVIAISAVYGHGGDAAPFAIAAVLVAVIYGGGHVSKAHYNPAVSLGFLLRGDGFTFRDLLGYLSAQILATLAASGIALSGIFAPVQPIEIVVLDPVPSLVAEIIFTFLLVWVIMHVATAKNLTGNQFYGIAIAAAVLAGIFTVGPISLAMFNPAVALEMVLLGKLSASQLWVPLLGATIGSVSAVMTFRYGEQE